MSDEVLYDHAVGILEDEFVNDPAYSNVDMRITYPNIKDVQFIDLNKGFKAVTGQFRDQFGDYVNFPLAIKGSNSKIKDYWWTVEYKEMEWRSW